MTRTPKFLKWSIGNIELLCQKSDATCVFQWSVSTPMPKRTLKQIGDEIATRQWTLPERVWVIFVSFAKGMSAVTTILFIMGKFGL